MLSTGKPPSLDNMDESRPSPLDGDTPLTAEERRRLRGLLLDDDRATWARKKLMVLVPVVVSAIVGLWQAWEFLSKHVKWSSP